MTKASFARCSGRAARRAVVGLAVALSLAAFSAPAAVAAGKRRVGVDVNGSPSGPIRAAIAAVLKHHGLEPAPAALSGDSGAAIAGAAKQGKLAAVIVGEVRDGGKRAKLRVYGAGGDLIGEGSWAEHGGIKKLAAAVERTLWARVGGALSKARAGEAGEKPGRAASADKAEARGKSEDKANDEANNETNDKTKDKTESTEEKSTYSRSEDTESQSDEDEGSSRRAKKKKHKAKASEDAEEHEDERPGAAPAATALDLGVGVRFLSRKLTWANNAVRGYSMGFAPAFGLTLAWYPAAHFGGGWPANIGLAASAELLPGYQSKTSDGTHYPTQENDYWAGVRGRLFVGPVEGALTLGGGQHAFVFRSGGTANRAALADLPDVQYTYVRAAIDLRIALPANLSLGLGAGYRYVLGAGDKNYLVGSSAFFPDAKITGLDVTGGLGYRVLPYLEGRAGVDLRRYSIATHATGAQPAVGSGTDQTLAFWVQAVLILDGVKGSGAAKAAPAEDAAKGDDADKAEADKAPAKNDAAPDTKPAHKDEDE